MEPKLLEKLAEAVENTGHLVMRNESSLLIEPINVRVECEVGERNQHQQGMVIAINIKATHEYLFPSGIRDSLAGIGVDEEEALSYGAAVWIDGVFSVIHELFVPPDKAGESVTRLDMVSKNQESGEEFAWKLYLGPIQATGFWRERITDERETFLVERLINEISSELYYKRMIGIKMFVSKLPDGSIHADCWLNNENWMEGLNALYWFAEEWENQNVFGALKQFMIIMPCQWSEIANADKIKKSLPEQ